MGAEYSYFSWNIGETEFSAYCESVPMQSSIKSVATLSLSRRMLDLTCSRHVEGYGSRRWVSALSEIGPNGPKYLSPVLTSLLLDRIDLTYCLNVSLMVQKWTATIFSTFEPILLIVHENDLFWYVTTNI